jgi:hypothetical protein
VKEPTLRELQEELNGKEVTLTMTVAGIIDFGSEVQLLLPGGMFTYLPTDVVRKALRDEH